MAVEEVGARLVVEGGAEAAADADALAAAIKRVNSAANSAAASMAKLDAAQKAQADSVAESTAAMSANADAQEENSAALVAAATAQKEAAKTQKAATADAEDAAEGVAAAETTKQKAVKGTTAVVESETKKQTSALDKFASMSGTKHLAAFGTAGILGTAYESVKAYTNFNKLVTQSAVDAGFPKKDLGQAQKQLLQYTKQTGVAADDAANSFYRVNSALSGTKHTLQDVYSLTKDSMKLDVLFNVPKGSQTEQVARIMGALKNSNLTGVGSNTHMMALVNSAVGHGDIRGADMISALGKLLPGAKAMGANLPDIMGWVDTLTKQGMNGSQAGTLIAHSVQQLAEPSEQGNKAEQMLGINGGDLKNMMAKQGIPATISYLTNAMKQFNPTSYYPTFNDLSQGSESALAQLQAWGITDPSTLAAFQAGSMNKKQTSQVQQAFLSKIFGSAKSALPMLALTNNEKGYASLVAAIKQAATAGNLKKSYNTALNTPGRQLDIAEARMEAAGIELGKALTPAAVDAAKVLADVVGKIAGNKAALIGIFGALAGATGIAAGAVVINKIVKMAKSLAAIGSGGLKGFQKVINALTGSSFGKSATTAAPTEQFSGAVTEFSGAVTRFTEGSLGGGGGGTGGVVGGAGGAATEAEEVEGLEGASFGSNLLTAGSKLGLAGVTAAAGVIAGNLIRGNTGSVYNAKHGTLSNARSVGGDVAEGAGIGASIGTLIPIPGVGTGVGAGIGALSGLIYGLHSQISQGLTSAWHSIFGGGKPSTPALGTTASNPNDFNLVPVLPGGNGLPATKHYNPLKNFNAPFTMPTIQSATLSNAVTKWVSAVTSNKDKQAKFEKELMSLGKNVNVGLTNGKMNKYQGALTSHDASWAVQAQHAASLPHASQAAQSKEAQTAANDAAKVQKQAASQLWQAALSQNKGNADMEKAANQTGTAQKQSIAAAKESFDAAAAHKVAAQKLDNSADKFLGVAEKLEAAAVKLGNTKITAQISTLAVAQASNQGNAQKLGKS